MAYSAIALTPAGDLDLSVGVVSGDDAIAATVIARLNCERGSYFADLGSGVDRGLVSGALGYLGLDGPELVRVALTVRGVRSASITEDSYNASTRTRTRTLSITTDNGAQTISLSGVV